MSFKHYLALVPRVRRAADLTAGRALAELRAVPHDEDSQVWWVAVALRAVDEVLGVVLHDEQIAASLAMAEGWTVEMLTGEGKTFAAIGAAMAFAAQERPVHIVTANAYLAERDVDWSGAVLRTVGFTTGLTTAGPTRDEVRRGYLADVVFGDVAAFGFDYLTDGLWLPGDAAVQRELDVAIVDEADAVLIDQARTPMILTMAGTSVEADIGAVGRAVRQLDVGADVTVDIDHRATALTDGGIARCEELLGIDNLYDASAEDWPTLVDHALRARLLLARDRDYVVHGGAVLPVDELTGRVAHNRRWPEGLQQAVEAKEGIRISPQRRPAGQCTVGSYFARYRTLVGMSGTLHGAENELREVFGIQLLAVPPNRPVKRVDHEDERARSNDEACDVVVADVQDRWTRGQPVLIGTTSIEDTTVVSAALAVREIDHAVLTAVNDHEEAKVIAAAGQRGAVTVATQLAGRGVDIVLGDDVAAVGGLMVWGLGHHRSTRQDNQLRGRSGRQGDPGESRFVARPDDEDVAAAERLDRALRDDVRGFEAVTDRLQEHLYEWRERAAGAPLAELTRSDALAQALDQRRAELGATMADGAARLILRMLLVELWSEALEILDNQQSLARIMPIVSRAQKRWEALSVETYYEFERTVEHEWASQLRAFQIVAELPPIEVPAPALHEPAFPPEPPDYQNHAWDGPSYTRFVRRHWYIQLPDPPLVLHLDAIGERASGDGLMLHLDLDDATNTVVAVT